MAENKKSAGTKWDGISRPSDDLYRKEFDRIFKKGIVGKDTTLGDVKDILDDRGPADLEKVIDTLKKKIRKLENSR